MSEFCVVTTTTDSQAHARALASILLEQGLAACVQIQAIESHYVWQGRQECANEWSLQIKTRRALYEALEGLIKAHHHYQVPQILCLPVQAGQANYLEWVRDQTALAPTRAV